MAMKIPNTEKEINLECPVCWSVPRSVPIYQCGNGHLLCKDCKPRLRECPICKTKHGFESTSTNTGFSFGTSAGFHYPDSGSFNFGGPRPSYGATFGSNFGSANIDQRFGIRNLMAEQLIES